MFNDGYTDEVWQDQKAVKSGKQVGCEGTLVDKISSHVTELGELTNARL